MRASPDTESNVILTAHRGTRVYVTGSFNSEWYVVNYNGQTGFMASEFLAPFVAPLMTHTNIGTIEVLPWGQARQLMAIGQPVTIIDVRTGITYRVASFSNGNHADVEPLTAADTAAMLQSLGALELGPQASVGASGRTDYCRFNQWYASRRVKQ